MKIHILNKINKLHWLHCSENAGKTSALFTANHQLICSEYMAIMVRNKGIGIFWSNRREAKYRVYFVMTWQPCHLLDNGFGLTLLPKT